MFPANEQSRPMVTTVLRYSTLIVKYRLFMAIKPFYYLLGNVDILFIIILVYKISNISDIIYFIRYLIKL